MINKKVYDCGRIRMRKTIYEVGVIIRQEKKGHFCFSFETAITVYTLGKFYWFKKLFLEF